MKKHYREENNCLNCGTILDGKFCHNCGQENLQIKENFGHLMNHAISDYFHFDHQFFHTLKPLLFQPGKLTNEYMAGKRVQYLHPIKMYIFISLVFFVLYFRHSGEIVTVDNKAATNKEAIDSAHKAIDRNSNLSPQQKAKLNKLISKGMRVHVQDNDDNSDTDDDKSSIGNINISDTDYPTYQKYLDAQSKLPADARDSYIERLFEKKKFDYKAHGGNPRELITEEVKHNVPKMMFVLLPLFAFILRITFWRSKKFYVEHLIFSFHLHCFIFLFIGIALLLEIFIPKSTGLHGWIDFIVTIGVIVYVYKALKAVYHRSRFRTITKMIGMSFVYLIAFSFCMIGVFFISALTAA